MTLEEKTALLEEFAEVRSAKKAAISAMGYSTGGTSVQRQSLESLVKEEKRLSEILKQNGIDPYSGNSTANKTRISGVIPI